MRQKGGGRQKRLIMFLFSYVFFFETTAWFSHHLPSCPDRIPRNLLPWWRSPSPKCVPLSCPRRSCPCSNSSELRTKFHRIHVWLTKASQSKGPRNHARLPVHKRGNKITIQAENTRNQTLHVDIKFKIWHYHRAWRNDNIQNGMVQERDKLTSLWRSE